MWSSGKLHASESFHALTTRLSQNTFRLVQTTSTYRRYETPPNMFRAAVNNEMDGVVARATDETLVSENWEYIFHVVDKVAASPSGPANATSSLIKRLARES